MTRTIHLIARFVQLLKNYKLIQTDTEIKRSKFMKSICRQKVGTQSIKL